MERLVKVVFFVGLLIYFLMAVVARTPAEWGAWVALRAVPNLSLNGVSGSLWAGKAASAQVVVNRETMDLGALQWRLDGLSLLLLKACMNVRSTTIQGEVCYGLGGRVTINKLLVDQVPAKVFYNNPGVQIGGTGNATVQHAELTLRNGGQVEIKDLAGSVTAQRMAINVGTGWFSLGSFAADATENGRGGVALNITDIEGDFSVQVQGDLMVGEQPQLSGVITPKETAPQPLKDALGVFMEMQDDGSYKLEWPIGG
ncbi:hypothetical protein DWB84_12365 [Saccharophagus sp. K07]|uniref:type II secretion system protein N n=1 Tax=Saccharophagus sp. K07 TaxID=2283636 RepID=UPI001652701F|nr:hypothetical protein [Saccharophagus sp. K07]